MLNASKTEKTPLLSKNSASTRLLERSLNVVICVEDSEGGIVSSGKSGGAPAAQIVRFGADNRVSPRAKNCQGDAAWLPGMWGGYTGCGGDETSIPIVLFEDALDRFPNPLLGEIQVGLLERDNGDIMML
jgi:hypothetical protein